MIFDPFRNMQHQRDIPRNLPPGAVPPGARFDPFGPPNPDDLTPGSIGLEIAFPNLIIIILTIFNTHIIVF